MAVDQDALNANFAGLQQAITDAHFTAPQAPRGALAEIGTGVARGFLSGLPTLGGQALKYTDQPGGTAYGIGEHLTRFGEEMAQKPWLAAQPGSHGAVTNALATGGEMLGPVLAPLAAIAAPAALAGAALPTAVMAGSVGGGLMFGASAGQDTLDKAKAAGVDPETAKTAARLNAGQVAATQVGLGLVGGQMMGVAGSALNKLAGRSTAALAADVMGDLTGTAGVVKPFLKQLPMSTAEGVAINAAQMAGTAGIEKAYGIDERTPGDAALESIGPSLGMMAMMTPLGLAGRALQVRSAQHRTAVMNHPETPPELRTELAEQYAQQLAKTDPGAAAAFRENAAQAISQKGVLPTDTAKWLEPGAVPPPEAPPPPAPPQVTAPGAGLATQELVDAKAGVNAPAPTKTERATRMEAMNAAYDAPSGQFVSDPTTGVERELSRGELLLMQAGNPAEGPAPLVSDDARTMHAQVRGLLDSAGVEAAKPMDRTQFKTWAAIEHPEWKPGQKVAKEYEAYLKDPATERSLMLADAQKYQDMRARELAAPEPELNKLPEQPPVAADFAWSDAKVDTANRTNEVDAAYAQRTAQQAAERLAVERDNERLATVAAGTRAAERAEVDTLTEQGRAERTALEQRATEDARYQQDADALRKLGVQPLPMVLDTSAHRAEVIEANARRLAELRPPEAAKAGQQVADNRPAEPAAEPAPFNPALAEGLAPVKAAMTAPDRVRRVDEIVADWKAASEAAGLDTKQQSRVPFEKRVAALGLDKMGSHEEQIGALYKLLADPAARLSEGARERIQALADTWREKFPAKPQESPVEVKPVEEPPPAPLPKGELPAKALPEETITSADSPAAWARAAREEAVRRIGDYGKRLANGGITPEQRAHMETLQAIAGKTGLGNPKLRPEQMTRELMQHIERELTRDPETLLSRRAEDDAPESMSRRNMMIATAAMVASGKAQGGELTLGKARALTEQVLGQRVSPVVEKLLRDGQAGGTTSLNGIKALRAAMVEIARAGPPELRSLAAKIRQLLPETGNVMLTVDDSRLMNAHGAVTFAPMVHMQLFTAEGRTGLSYSTLLHESLHLAVAARYKTLSSAMVRSNDAKLGMSAPHAVKAMEQFKNLWNEFDGMVAREKITDKGLALSIEEARANPDEFFVRALTDSKLQQWMASKVYQGKTLFERFKDWVKTSLLGFKKTGTEASWLDAALTASDDLTQAMGGDLADFKRLRAISDYNGRQAEHSLLSRAPEDFNKSPAGAAKATDGVLKHVLGAVDNLAARLHWNDVPEAVMPKLLSLQSMEHMVQRARAQPVMVRFGFSKGVDAEVAAHDLRDAAARHLDEMGSRYAGEVDKQLRLAEKAGKNRQALELEMQTIAGEASRGGFDYRKNGKDNLAKNADLTIDKESMDDIHRRFTQLQRAHPELAKAIERGEMTHRKELVTKIATLSGNLMEGAKRAHSRLAADLAALTPADKTYAEVASRVAQASGDSALALAHQEGLKFLDPTLKEGSNADPTRWLDTSASNLAGRLDAAFVAAKQLPAGSSLRQSLEALETLYRAQVKAPYFSLGRDGSHFVKVAFKGVDAAAQARIEQALQGTNKVVGNLVGKDGHAFFRVESRDQAQGLHDKLTKAGQGTVVDGVWGNLLDRNDQPKAGLSNVMRGLMDALENAVSLDPNLDPGQGALMREAMTRQVMQLLPETAARSAATPRKGVPGYDGNFLRSFMKRASGSVQDISNAYANRAFSDAARQRLNAIDAMNRSADPESADARGQAARVHDELTKRYQNGLKLVDNDVVNQIASFGHSWYLGFSPAYHIRNMAQPWHRGLPVVGSKFGYAPSSREIARATPTALQIVRNTINEGNREGGWRGVLGANPVFEGVGLSKSEQAFLQEMHDRGKLGLGQAHQLQRQVVSEDTRVQNAIKISSMTAQMSELTNRLVMGLSAFRLAERAAAKDPKLLGKESPTDYAIRATSMAMDNYDPINTARAISKHGMLGPVTPLVAQFQNYNLHTMQQIVRTVQDGLFNHDKSDAGLLRAKEARREFAGLMATTTFISGALGLPFANAFAGVYNMLTSDPDDPKDIRISAKNWLADNFGKDVGEILAHGAPRAINMDSSTFGLQSILPGSDFLANRASWKDRIEQQSQQMMGPALNGGLDFIGGLNKIMGGDYVKGIEQMLPTGLKALYKAGEQATLGYTDSKGNPIALEATPWSIGLQGVGFQTGEKADQGMAARDFSQNQALLQERRTKVNDQMYKSLILGRGNVDEAINAMVDFNVKNPFQPITQPGTSLQSHLQKLAIAGASGTGVGTSKRLMPKLMEDERFAAMPRD